MLQRFLIAVLSVSLLVACAPPPGPAIEPAPTPPPTVGELIEYMRSATVAIVRDGDIYCSGVWLNPDMILTAAHCVAPEGPTMFATYDEYDVHGGMDQMRPGSPAYLIRKDDVQDVALLLVDKLPLMPHASAVLSDRAPQAGDRVQMVGHTLGIPYCWAPGFVDGVRWMSTPEIGIAGEFVQVWGGAWGGNSGGGLWDLDGRLLGITSFRAGPLHWFVSGNAIRDFLAP